MQEICENCGKDIEPARFAGREWRHSSDGMFVCFGPTDRPMRVGDLYLLATPKQAEK